MKQLCDLFPCLKNYDYEGRYLASVTVRRDASSRLAKGSIALQPFLPFPLSVYLNVCVISITPEGLPHEAVPLTRLLQYILLYPRL